MYPRNTQFAVRVGILGSEFRARRVDTDLGGENLRMKASAQPTISAEVQDPRFTPGVGLVRPGVVKSERMVDRRAANRQRARNRLGFIHYFRGQRSRGGL